MNLKKSLWIKTKSESVWINKEMCLFNNANSIVQRKVLLII